MIVIRNLENNQISAFNSQKGIYMPLNKLNRTSGPQNSEIKYHWFCLIFYCLNPETLDLLK